MFIFQQYDKAQNETNKDKDKTGADSKCTSFKLLHVVDHIARVQGKFGALKATDNSTNERARRHTALFTK